MTDARALAGRMCALASTIKTGAERETALREALMEARADAHFAADHKGAPEDCQDSASCHRWARALSGEESTQPTLTPEIINIIKDLIHDVGEHGAAGMSLDAWRSPEGMAALAKVNAVIGSHAEDMRKAMQESIDAKAT
jgi:hypothetical protein